MQNPINTYLLLIKIFIYPVKSLVFRLANTAPICIHLGKNVFLGEFSTGTFRSLDGHVETNDFYPCLELK